MVTVWRITSLSIPTLYELYPTRELAEASTGTQYRHLYGPVTSEERNDVLFAVIKAGDLEAGGGSLRSLHRTYAGACAAVQENWACEKDSIEIFEVSE